ncbi:MAG: HRDC domain-containing protein [Micrococcales bacterium]|nr:HRDC domain-containing protein [Micrococcales bacterium]
MKRAASAIAAGSGPVAMDAERASGYRYGQHAYLVQLRRREAGTWLIDPVACPDLTPVGVAIGDTEWILHAATQDLVCLAELGMRPRRLFDTELGGRLAGLPRVGLGTMVEHYLGLTLAKEHSAVDWSTRPLPESWLLYAALDVEVLEDLRDAVSDDLASQGKDGWAAEEFEALLDFTGPAPRVDPWRRTSGVHRVRTRRGLAIVRALWQVREEIAEQRDTAPGRVLPDAAIVELALAHHRATTAPTTVGSSDPRLRRSIRRTAPAIIPAIDATLRLPEAELPPVTTPSIGPPPAKSWTDRDPVAAARLAGSRELLQALSEEIAVPIANILSPDLLRRYLWDGPAEASTQDVASAFQAMGARRWQTTLAAPLIARSIDEHPVSR